MIILIIFTAIIAILFAHTYFRHRKLPPGPIPLPILGTLPYLAWLTVTTGSIVNAMHRIKKDYGSVFTLWFGPIATIHISNHELANEAMVKQGGEYTDRWVPFIMNQARGDYGIVFSNGDHWRDQRRFALHTLRNFGLGRNLMEDRIMSEYNYRTQLLEDNPEQSDVVDGRRFFDLLVGSVIQRLLVSGTFDKENEREFFDLKDNLDKMIESASFVDLFANEWVMKVPFLNKRYKKIIKPQYDVKEWLMKQIEQRCFEVSNGDRVLEDEGTDYMEAFLIKMQEEKDSYGFNKESLATNLLDLWIAGLETTSTTLQWATIILLNNAEVVDKVREEVSGVTGNIRKLSLKDRQNTPYLTATISEIQRHASILNFNLWRMASSDCRIGKYEIPRKVPIAVQLSLILSDDKIFKDPTKFDPSRFLKSSLDQYMIQFGMGKRVCLGESLARAELYLILGNLLHDYNLSPVSSAPSLSPVTSYGIMRRPRHFEMKLTKILY